MGLKWRSNGLQMGLVLAIIRPNSILCCIRQQSRESGSGGDVGRGRLRRPVPVLCTLFLPSQGDASVPSPFHGEVLHDAPGKRLHTRRGGEGLCGEGTLASPSSPSRDRLSPPARATPTSPPPPPPPPPPPN